MMRAIGICLIAGLSVPAVRAAAPQAPVRVGGAIKEPRKTANVDPAYPEIALKVGVSGMVIIEATIDREGNVADAHVLRSNPLFDEAALAAVRQWKYEPTVLNGAPVEVLMTVVVNFLAKPGGSDQAGSEADWRQVLSAAPTDVDAMLQLIRIYRESGRLNEAEQMLQRALDQVHAERGVLAPQADVVDRSAPVRVGGPIAEPRKIKDVVPVYPAEALAAHISGNVVLEVVLAKDGSVKSARTLRAAPPFEQAAIDAVKQWVYAPTLVDGQPVEVAMTVVVNFVLR